MTVASSRIEAFSDGVMAIIITIMAFNIPLPKELTGDNIIALARAIGIFFVSFIVVGAQWVKHHWMFGKCSKVSVKVMWRNILYLFFLSLIPLFTKWMMENPKEVIPALCYDVLFLSVAVSSHLVFSAVIKDTGDVRRREMAVGDRQREERRPWMFFGIVIVGIALIFTLSFFFPGISIVFFAGLPVASSVANMWVDDEDRFRRKRKQGELIMQA